ncbi:F-box/kelch-repeat protein At4g39560-like [Raphanus sativus]|uniref:F-box/kelch-repeat protein At4g39560-like n=1 Tax=Raphanus sativus TaxID=3726 RepID=A0A9W3D9F5_RAPSA|nr:F-box/kelch-repeat protein At4g39560-like [Raphanus sativus]XP_056860328.1 F-box/kelch-repeat protein At4g39560-like [Raphanus sativus]
MNTCDADEEPSRTRKKLKLSCSSPPSGLSLLPDEIVLSCLARVSKSDHASLSLVSKWHRSVVASPELYDFRSLLGFTENRIYLCLRIPPDPNPRWFTLSPKTLNLRLVPVRSYFYQPPEASCMVAHGCGIYIMGGKIDGRATSNVLFLDCRSHTWSTLPSMGMARYSAVAGVVDGRIYVFGGCEGRESGKWGEVFDPKQQTWDALPMPPPRCDFPLVCESIVIEEQKVVVMNGLGICLSYIPSESKWKKGYRDISGIKRCWHVIDNVVYCSLSGGQILWCEPSELEWNEKMEWREVMGLESLRDTLAASKMVNYGGGLEIWCAEISLEIRKKTCEIIGNIVWSEAVMTLDPPPHQHHCKILSALPLNL